MENISEGDICLFQFGHNDQKLDHLGAAEGYRNNLIRYVEEIRKKGAIPYLSHPLPETAGWKMGVFTTTD